MFVRSFLNLFSSLKLTVTLLCLSIVLVFAGTIAQVQLGLYQAQTEYFRRFFVYWALGDTGIRVPVFPGGYLLGLLLLLNISVVAFRRFAFTKNKIGIWLIHLGLILLFVGQLLTDLLSVESMLHLREGETKNYSERPREAELVLVDRSQPDRDRVITVPESRLGRGGTMALPGTPLRLTVERYYRNSTLERLTAERPGQPAASQGIGRSVEAIGLPHATEMNRRDVPSVVVRLSTDSGDLGTWLASEYINQSQHIHVGDRAYDLSMRPRREYKPYSMTLLKFTHDRYPGTQIPKNFSSRVRLQNPSTGEDREVLIYMNNPLRYDGKTFYQSSFDTDDRGSVLQVVRNPSWLTPYLSCVLVSIGLTVQFMTHLVPYVRRKIVP